MCLISRHVNQNNLKSDFLWHCRFTPCRRLGYFLSWLRMLKILRKVFWLLGCFLEAVEQAVEQLPADLRQALLLRELEGLSYEEIAALVNCPVGTVRSRIFRARQTVAERLEPLLERRSGGRW